MKKKEKVLTVMDILAKIANGETDFKFRVKDEEGYGKLFEVKDGVLYSHGEAVRWTIYDEWLNYEAKIESNDTEETEEEQIGRELDKLIEALKKLTEDKE